MSGHQVRVTELSSSGRKRYRTICGNPGQKSKDKAVSKTFPNLSALSLIISLTHLLHNPPSSCKPTMGRGRFTSRQSYNCSYQAYILTTKKSHLSQILPEGSSLQLPFEKVPHGSLKLFWSPLPGYFYKDDTATARAEVCADAAILLERHRFCTAEKQALCFK